MRYKDIWLVESTVEIKRNINSISDDVNTIVQTTQEVNTPKVNAHADNILQSLIGYLKQIMANFKPLSEAADENLIDTVEELLNQINNTSQEIPDDIRIELVQSTEKIAKLARKSSTEHKTAATREFQRGITKGYEGGFEKGAEAQVLKSITDDSNALRKTEFLVKRFSTNLANNPDFVKSVKSIFDGRNLKSDEINEFLDGALRGDVIDLKTAVKKEAGNINDHVRAPYKNVWEKTGGAFMALQDPSAQRGSVGPAEIAIILLGSPVKKADKGDLDIDGTVYELKASKVSTGKKKGKSGGRLTADSMPKNNTILAGVQQLLTQHFEVNDKDLMKTVKSKKTGKTRKLPRFGLGIDGLTFLNELSSYYGPGYIVINGNKEVEGTVKNRIQATKSFLYDFMATVMPATMDKKKNVTPIINAMVNKDGTVDTAMNGNFFQQYLKANWIEYKTGAAKEHFEALMFIHQGTMNYHIVRSGDDLVDAVKDGRVQITKGATFTDPQNPAAPQLYTL